MRTFAEDSGFLRVLTAGPRHSTLTVEIIAASSGCLWKATFSLTNMRSPDSPKAQPARHKTAQTIRKRTGRCSGCSWHANSPDANCTVCKTVCQQWLFFRAAVRVGQPSDVQDISSRSRNCDTLALQGQISAGFRRTPESRDRFCQSLSRGTNVPDRPQGGAGEVKRVRAGAKPPTPDTRHPTRAACRLPPAGRWPLAERP